MNNMENWTWLPRPAHFCCSDKCRFHLATEVGGYIVSTVGELFFDSDVRRLTASVKDKEWFAENEKLKGDYFDIAYMKRFGFEDIGTNRKYETMVFKSTKNYSGEFEIVVTECVDSKGYNDDKSAIKGHTELCLKWSKSD